jgi:hypothetical protein
VGPAALPLGEADPWDKCYIVVEGPHVGIYTNLATLEEARDGDFHRGVVVNSYRAASFLSEEDAKKFVQAAHNFAFTIKICHAHDFAMIGFLVDSE